MSTVTDRFPCPSCQSIAAILTVERFGVRTFLCLQCEHVWEEPPIYVEGRRPG